MSGHILLNLDAPDHFKFWNFPGGEVGCTAIQDLGGFDSYSIRANINTPEQVFRLISAVDVIKRHHAEHKTGPVVLRDLKVWYFPYARQDRRDPGTSFILPLLVDLIDNLGFHSIHIADPHSSVLPALFRKTNVRILTLSKICSQHLPIGIYEDNSCVIAPDAGASKRANEVAAYLDLPVVQCIKSRNAVDGKLTNLTAPDVSAYDHMFVVDDICDGGGTFIKLASALGVDKKKLTLVVTHGIFSGKALANLHTCYSKVITTDSWQSAESIRKIRNEQAPDLNIYTVSLS